MKISTQAYKTLRNASAAGCLLVALGVGVDASAQTYPPCNREPTESDLEGAKGAHKAAEAHYNKGAYERAIQAWQDAYGFDCTAHRLLINIGNAYEKLGKLPDAIEAFETYLQRTGDAADRTIEDKVSNLRARLQQQSAAPPAPTATGAGTSTSEPAPPPQPPEDDGDGGAGPGVGPWVVVGAGGVVTVVGVVLLAVGANKKADAQKECDYNEDEGLWDCSASTDPEKYAALGDTGRKLTGVGGAGIGVGLAAVAGGLIWYFVASGDDEDSQGTWVHPMVGPTTAGLGLSGTF